MKRFSGLVSHWNQVLEEAESAFFSELASNIESAIEATRRDEIEVVVGYSDIEWFKSIVRDFGLVSIKVVL